MRKKFKIIKDNYERLSEHPDVDLWNRLEDKLDGNPSPKKPLWTYFLVASVLLVGGLFLLFNISDDEVLKTDKTSFSIEKREKLSKTQEIVVEEKEENVAMVSPKNKVEKNDSPTILKKNKPQNKKPLAQNNIVQQSTVFVKKNKVEEPKSILKNETLVLKKQPQKVVKSAPKVEYVNTNDLLFASELEKVETENQVSERAKIGLNVLPPIQEPKSIEIIGIKIK
ncbi:MAG: hypothetical protein CSA38_02360 [Flavobacteriales bacterium]|nr:MAG: hypothetical protein CSA38_02360 [Flavobacteriales bacterium]